MGTVPQGTIRLRSNEANSVMQMEGLDTITAFLHTIPEWLILISLTFCIGTLVFRLWVLEYSADSEDLYQGNLFTRMWRFFSVGLAVLIASSIVDLFVRGVEMSGQPFSDVLPILPTVVFRTHIGHVWLIRISALIVFSATYVTARRYRDSRGFLVFLLGLGVVVSLTESASGHPSDKGDFSIAEIVDWFHLIAASIWGGGLLLLSSVVLPELARHGERIAPLNASVARRFSAIAGVAVGIIVVTSLYNAWSYVGSFGAFRKTPYGWTAVAKILLFSLILYLGAFNRYVSVPLLQRACIYPGGQRMLERIAVHFFPRYLCTEEKSLIFSRFMWSVKVEAVLLVGVLLCAGLLRHETPARHASHLEHGGREPHPMHHSNGEVLPTQPNPGDPVRLK